MLIRKRTAFLLLAALLACALGVAVAIVESAAYPPRLLAPYVQHRAAGHAPWIERTAASVSALLLRLDRGPERTAALEYPRWKPRAIAASDAAAVRTRLVANPLELKAAIADARPGDSIQLLPGRYVFDGRSIEVTRAGRPDAPIRVSAARPGSAKLVFNMLEGFHVQAAHWHFDGLEIVGTCPHDSDCEHAFHVVGEAQGFSLRNSEIVDFNAHLKINGSAGRFPDGGVIEGNILRNTRGRDTSAPVTPIDLVAASHWRIRANLIADFQKTRGDLISYGAFAKGAGEGNRFESNVVLCEYRVVGTGSREVGMSLGGGGTDRSACRDKLCVAEQADSVLSSNLVAFCTDDGIYLNRATRSLVAHNTVIDTAGIQARYEETGGTLRNNLVDGVVRLRDGASMQQQGNRSDRVIGAYLGLHPVRKLFVDFAALDLAWSGSGPGRVDGDGERDMCGRLRQGSAAVGAFSDIADCASAEHSMPAN
ncbi:hypothetical protein GCM10025771_37880 [Niveibacterium umoris]|uniref:Right handed beta helix domain-containing protein n=1 Tax=Niveibacterium umoris TaxID=1193620 RepID=A0A840BBU1_9RHOO|nr:right-handed parallel beta-helix repeat-containing protein [Niveibacterium umoris]MBB4011011.1 hypothetical protein [Niveibacterium umoris]